MTEKNTTKNRECDPRHDDCGFKGDPERGTLLCGAGANTCSNAILLEAERSAFHTAELIKATKAINEILASISKSENCNLRFIHPKQGTMLALVEHGGKLIKKAITANDDPKVVAKFLKLI